MCIDGLCWGQLENLSATICLGFCGLFWGESSDSEWKEEQCPHIGGLCNTEGVSGNLKVRRLFLLPVSSVQERKREKTRDYLFFCWFLPPYLGVMQKLSQILSLSFFVFSES